MSETRVTPTSDSDKGNTPGTTESGSGNEPKFDISSLVTEDEPSVIEEGDEIVIPEEFVDNSEETVSEEAPTVESAEPVTEEPTSQEEQFVNIGGKKYSLNEVQEWQRGNLRHRDYTKKTQELASFKKQMDDKAQLYGQLDSFLMSNPEILGVIQEHMQRKLNPHMFQQQEQPKPAPTQEPVKQGFFFPSLDNPQSEQVQAQKPTAPQQPTGPDPMQENQRLRNEVMLKDALLVLGRQYPSVDPNHVLQVAAHFRTTNLPVVFNAIAQYQLQQQQVNQPPPPVQEEKKVTPPATPAAVPGKNGVKSVRVERSGQNSSELKNQSVKVPRPKNINEAFKLMEKLGVRDKIFQE